MDIFTLANNLATARFPAITANRRAQFGLPGRRYLGPTILPERLVAQNAYREEQIKFRSIIANASARYGPVQLKQGAFVGSMLVELSESDIGGELSSRDLDALRAVLQNQGSLEAEANLINFVETSVNTPLIEYNEKMRWDCLVDAEVELIGNNEYLETVQYADPAGNRVAAADSWTDDTYDPMEDIFAVADAMEADGYPLRLIVTSRQVMTILGNNDKIRTRTGRISVSNTGQIQTQVGRVTRAELNGIFGQDGLPAPVTYDLQYRTNTGTERFLKPDVMVFIGATSETEQVDLGDVIEPIEDVLGYLGVGVPAGQDGPGRALFTATHRDKPPRIETQGWQTSLPVVRVPGAVRVVHTIT